MTYEQFVEGQQAPPRTFDQSHRHQEDDRRSLTGSRKCLCGALFFGSDTEQRIDLAAHCWVENEDTYKSYREGNDV